MRRASIVAVIAGAVLLIAGAVVRWGVAPATVKLPSNTDTTRTYAGTATTLLNTTALASGDLSNVVLTNVPIVATHSTKVLKSSSGSSLVSDNIGVTAGGAPVLSTSYQYAVNRKNMGRGSGFSGVIDQTGITFNFPINTARHDYTGWVPSTARTTNLKYTGTDTKNGLNVYVFTTTTAAAPLTDAQQLKSLPSTLPKAQLPALATALGVSPALLSTFASALAQLPAQVPLAYTYAVDATYYIAPASGIVVDIKQHETRGVSIPGGSFPTFPVADLSFTSTPATLAAAVSDARSKGNSIDLVQSTLPWSLAGAGGGLAVIGLVMTMASGRRPRTIVLPQMPATLPAGGHVVPQPRETPTDQPAETTKRRR